MGQKTDLGKTIRSVKRDIYLVVLVGGLIILLIYITRKHGGLYDRISDTEYIEFLRTDFNFWEMERIF